MNAAPAKTAVAVNRFDRRKAHTRQALIGAAVRLIAEGRGERPTVQEITEAADIGLGSFYNHFAGKDKLFQTASEQVLESWGKIIDDSCRGVDDPAQVFAMSFRITGRLAWTDPVTAHFITAAGPDLLEVPGGLAPRALRDIRAAEAVGRFTALDPDIALSAVAGGLLGLLRLQERERDRVDTAAVDALAESCLRLFGIDPTEAHQLTRLPLPRGADLNVPEA